MCCQMVLAGWFDIPRLSNEMIHLVPAFLASYLTVGGWNEPDLPHFQCLLFVVVGFPRWRTEVMLPEMYHFMRQSRKYLLRCSGRKMRRIQRDFIGDFLLV